MLVASLGSVMAIVGLRGQAFMDANTVQATRVGRLRAESEIAEPLADQMRPPTSRAGGFALLVKGISCSIVDV